MTGYDLLRSGIDLVNWVEIGLSNKFGYSSVAFEFDGSVPLILIIAKLIYIYIFDVWIRFLKPPDPLPGHDSPSQHASDLDCGTHGFPKLVTLSAVCLAHAR